VASFPGSAYDVVGGRTCGRRVVQPSIRSLPPSRSGRGDSRHKGQRHKCWLDSFPQSHPRPVTGRSSLGVTSHRGMSYARFPSEATLQRRGGHTVSAGSNTARTHRRVKDEAPFHAHAFTRAARYVILALRLITNVTNVSVVRWTAPVICQQPSVGKMTPLDWKPVAPYPAGTLA
jgi:hypothetical protein